MDWSELFGVAGWGVVLVGAPLCVVTLARWRQAMRRLTQAQSQITHLEDRIDAILSHQEQGVITLGLEAHSALNGITGYAEFVAHNATDPMIQFTGTIIYENSLKLLRTTDVMLALLRSESTQSMGPSVDFSLQSCFEAMRHEFAFSLNEKNILFETSVDDNLPELILGMSQYVQKVVANLTENAIRFCGEGGRLRLHAELTEDQNFVHIRVEDNGPLLSRAALDDIFQQSDSLHASLSSPLGDAGATLLVAHHLARVMGGRLSHTPTTDKGNMFHFFFPLLPTGSTE